jgi:tetratricopeptide (TPR) repeat protein
MAKNKKPRSGHKGGAAPRQLLARLEAADRLMQRRHWAEAHDHLERLNREYPQQEPVLERLVAVAVELNDARAYQAGCEALLRLRPADPDLPYMLATAYLANGWTALALLAYRRALQTDPANAKALEAREKVAALEPAVNARLGEVGLDGADGLDFLARHEEMQSLLSLGRYAKAREVADKLLQRRPQFAPALNNAAESWFRDGRVNEAIATAQRVLAFDPQNLHALANLVRYHCALGKRDEARSYAQRLGAVTSGGTDVWVKKAEALSCLGDDQGVLDALRAAQASEEESPPVHDALLHHLGAVAAYRLGREDEAREHWRDALRRMPGFDPARENLADLDRPPGERHAPWYYSMEQWISAKVIDGLLAHVKVARGRDRDEGVRRQAMRYLEVHPELAGLVPLLLDQGDRAGREFAMHLADLLRTPEVLAAARDFALGQRGPDALRIRAAQLATQAGLLPAAPVRMWLDGEWQEIMNFGFEIHSDPPEKGHSARVEKLLVAALRADREDHDPVRAEQLIKDAIALEPDRPDLLNNLGAMYEAQGRNEESEALLRQIHERFPDYLFGRTVMARLRVRAGDLDGARELLEPLLSRRRLHRSELAALAAAWIDLSLARGQADSARSWFDIWRRLDPEHPGLRHYQRGFRPGGRDG